MLFIGRSKYHIPGLERMPFPIAVNFAEPCVDKNFVFPGVRVPWGMPAGSNFKDAHAKMICLVTPADHDTAGNALAWSLSKWVGGTDV